MISSIKLTTEEQIGTNPNFSLQFRYFSGFDLFLNYE